MRTITFIMILYLGASPPPTSMYGAQQTWEVSMPPLQGELRSSDEESARKILMGAKDALSSGNVAFLRSHLGQRVYLNLLNGTSGYYSSEQAYIILTSFFSTWTPISFSFSSRNFSIANPYGFGPLNFERRGRRGIAELFLSLTHTDDRWVINQITVSSR